MGVRDGGRRGGRIKSSPAVGSEGSLYFGSTDGKLYAVVGSGGPALTAWPTYRRNQKRTGAVSNPVVDHVSLNVNVYAGLVIHGNVGGRYRIEFTDNVSELWQFLATVTLDRPMYRFFDLESTNATKRFYRAVELP
jgi:outer membrane protein assembly factor BamB